MFFINFFRADTDTQVLAGIFIGLWSNRQRIGQQHFSRSITFEVEYGQPGRFPASLYRFAKGLRHVHPLQYFGIAYTLYLAAGNLACRRFPKQLEDHRHRDYRVHVLYMRPTLRLPEQGMIYQVGMALQGNIQFMGKRLISVCLWYRRRHCNRSGLRHLPDSARFTGTKQNHHILLHPDQLIHIIFHGLHHRVRHFFYR